VKKLALLLFLCIPISSSDKYDPSTFAVQYNKWNGMVERRVSEGDTNNNVVDLKERKEWNKTKEDWPLFE
jgi:hypothetical protein